MLPAQLCVCTTSRWILRQSGAKQQPWIIWNRRQKAAPQRPLPFIGGASGSCTGNEAELWQIIISGYYRLMLPLLFLTHLTHFFTHLKVSQWPKTPLLSICCRFFLNLKVHLNIFTKKTYTPPRLLPFVHYFAGVFYLLNSQKNKTEKHNCNFSGCPLPPSSGNMMHCSLDRCVKRIHYFTKYPEGREILLSDLLW